MPKIYAQNTESYKLKALFVYHFTKYLEWPIEKRGGDFIIGVYGDDMVYDYLSSVAKIKNVSGFSKITVIKINDVKEITPCHILFVGSTKSYELSKISIETPKNNTLLISDVYKSLSKGACIEFIVSNKNRLGFKINTTQIEQSKISIATQLISMAAK